MVDGTTGRKFLKETCIIGNGIMEFITLKLIVIIVEKHGARFNSSFFVSNAMKRV